MKLYNNSDHYKLYEGNMLDMLEVIGPCTIDSIVTDPPYGLTTITKRFGGENSAPNVYGKDGSFARLTKGFMGKAWDGSGVEYNVDAWRKCYQVLKHGGYLLAFGGTRTYHRIACAIEDAGFEIRDTIMWLYGSGFPKSLNIGLAIDKKNGVESPVVGYTSQQDIRSGNYTGVCTNNHEYQRIDWPIKKASNEWNGWGTALKPAYEPIIVARKPCEGSCIDNVLRYRTGAINIDECRVGDDLIKGGTTPDLRDVGNKQKAISGQNKLSFGQVRNAERVALEDHIGRYPSNVILTYDDSDFDEVCGNMPETAEDSAARYFYCAKASKKDRDEGLDQFEYSQATDGNIRRNAEFAPNIRAVSALRRNTHPTVKPCELMQYLVRLVTPPHGTVLDPFNGSGSTGKACMYENRERQAGYKYIGIEITPEYLPIAAARISHACGEGMPDIDSSGEKVAQGQMNIFELLGGNADGKGD